MKRWPAVLLGVVSGVAAGFVILLLTGGRTSRPVPTGPVLSECDGQLRELVIHYEPAAREIVTGAYRDFLRALDAGITVHVVCSSRPAFEELASWVGPVHCRLNALVVAHPITAWSRDRWLALRPAGGGPITLWSPRGEAGQEIWGARAGDERVGQDLAAALAPGVRARRSSLYFDAGDFLADADHVFIVPRVLQRNIQHTVSSRDEFVRLLGEILKRRVILLEQAPDHHAAMFMATVGDRTMLVGDPRLGKEAFASAPAAEGRTVTELLKSLPGGADFSPATQQLLDAVATQCASAGYNVVRIPVIPGADSRTYLTYTNVLIDRQGARRIVFLPSYRGAEALNQAARAVWEELGYEVRPVDCTSTFRHFGCLHCLVNVLARG